MIIAKKEKLKEKRLSMGLNKKQLSEKAGLSPNAIGRIENEGSKYVHPIRAKAIAEALGCPFEELFIRE